MNNIGVRNKLCAVIGIFCLVTGCASNSPADPKDPKDPWEGANRAVFEFNEKLDAWVAKPVAKGYRFITPSFVEAGVDNFFDNFLEVPNALNNLLQGKWKQAGNNGSRLLLNTFAGLGGLVDVATEVGLEKGQNEDFGQTLQVWGVPKGPYVVLPVLGPSTLTDAAAVPVNWYSNPRAYIPKESLRHAITGLDYINIRASLLDAEGLVNGDKYLFYREAYLQNREFQVKDGAIEDDFGGDLDDFEDF